MITIIGSGNVAWHLAKGFEASGLPVNAVYSRQLVDAESITNELYHAEATNSLDFSASSSIIFVLAVSDDAICAVAKKLILPPDATIVHVSGAMPLSVLEEIYAENRNDVTCGVFYPLMTFTKYKHINLSDVPFCIESSHESVEQFLLVMAQRMSRKAQVISSEERLILHLGAVFACNFTNHLLAVSQELVEANDLDFELLKPLISETIEKALTAENPADVQTGPAIRNDTKTMQKHEEMLEDDLELQTLYQKLSHSIQTFFA